MIKWDKELFPTLVDNRNSNNPAYLKRAIDENKCQAYFLSRMPQESLKDTIFPVGGLNKNVVKHLAANKFGLDFLSKKSESMGICFIGKRTDFSNFINDYTESKEGKLVDVSSGDILGDHSGLEHFTIGKSPKDKFVKWKTSSTRETYFWPNKPIVIGCDKDSGKVYLSSKK